MRSPREAHKILILITDGIPNANPGGGCNANIWNGDLGPNDPDFECAVFFGNMASANNVTVFTVGVGNGVDRDLLTAIAEGHDPHSTSGSGDEFLFDSCGGRFFNAAKPTDLDAILDFISAPDFTGCSHKGVKQVTISGPTTGLTQIPQTFTATVSPMSAVLPITYIWTVDGQPSVTHIRGITDTVTYTWNTSGGYSIRAFAQNAFGDTVGFYSTFIAPQAVAPTDVNIAGPTTGFIQANYTFTATVTPPDVTNEFVTYVWQTAGQPPITHTKPFDRDNVTFAWDTPGLKTITVTVSNSKGSITNTHQININPPVPPANIEITGSDTGFVQSNYVFTATLTPQEASQHRLTYIWQTAGQPPITHTKFSDKDSAIFTWDTPGLKTVTVTASNSSGTVTNTYQININPALCHPLLTETGFETAPAQAWRLGVSENVNLNPSSTESYNGLLSLDASTFDGSFNRPYFFQQFTLPTWVNDFTYKLNLRLYKNVDALADGDNVNDLFYAVVTTAPNVASGITTPTLVAQGVNSGGWTFLEVTFDLLNGINLTDYAGQPLYIYFYNDSNENCPVEVCHASRYLFDDISLLVTQASTCPPLDPAIPQRSKQRTYHEGPYLCSSH